jgi:hypothetical protein
MFGLPAVTALFVIGGFVLAVVLSVVFALRFSADDEEWTTLDDVFRRS